MHVRLLLLRTLFLAGLGISQHAKAEGRCPPGQYPIGSANGVLGCAPIPGAGDSGGSNAPPPYIQSVKMVPRWISYARSPDGLVMGWSVRQHKERASDRQALKACNKRSGQKCEIVARVTNEQCAYAMVHRDTSQLEVVLGTDVMELPQEVAQRSCPNGCRNIRFECARPFDVHDGAPTYGPNWYP